MMFLMLIPVLLILSGLSIYIWFWLKNTGLFSKLNPKGRGFLMAGAAGVLCVCSINLFSNAGIVLLHFWVFSMLTDLLLRLPIPHKKPVHYLLPLLITGLLMAYGSWNVGHVQRTEYTLPESRLSAPLRILLITDVHYDTIQDPSVLRDAMEEMNGSNPDLVVLGGDIVEEGTSAQRMREVFGLLGGLRSTYGTYYVYGNHDRQLYSSSPRYTQQELRQAIEDSGITILQDESVPIGEEILLVGREDASRPRRPAAELIPAGEERFVILADHQPTHSAENAAAGADLQLSGHTHAGQVWPVGAFLELFGLNYGAYNVDGSPVIVSSGFAGWGFTVRTSEHCEYVVLDVGGQ